MIEPSFSLQAKCSSPNHPGDPLLSSLHLFLVSFVLGTPKLNEAFKCWIAYVFSSSVCQRCSWSEFDWDGLQYGFNEIAVQTHTFSINL